MRLLMLSMPSNDKDEGGNDEAIDKFNDDEEDNEKDGDAARGG